MSKNFRKQIFDADVLPAGLLAPHWHDDFEIVYILSGTLAFHINHKTYLASANEGFFLNAGQVHFAEKYKSYPCRFLVFNISQNLLHPEADDQVFRKYIQPVTSSSSFCHITLVPRIPWQKYILENIKKMTSLCQSMEYGYEFKIQHFANEIFYYILQNISSIPELSRQQKKDIVRVKAAMTYLNETYPQKHTLQDIAASCQLSRSECSRLFQRILHCSPVDYLIRLRIFRSLPMVAAHDRPMSAIARDTGFSGGSYFSETFKKVMGCTPRDYCKSKLDHQNFSS